MESDLCCVCGAHLKQKPSLIVVEQSTNIISLIYEWIAPRIVSENDCICQSCYKRGSQTLKESTTTKMKETNIGLDMEVFEDTEQSFNVKCSETAEGHVCLLCDTLLSTRSSFLLIKDNPTELDQLILNLINEAIPSEIKISSEDKVCSKCWSKLRRAAIHLQQINELKLNGIRDGNQSVEIKSNPESDQSHSELIKSESEDTDSSQIDNSESTIKPANDKNQKNNGYEYLSDLDPDINQIKDDLSDPDFIVKTPIKKKIKKYPVKQKKEQNEDSIEFNPFISYEIVLPSYKRAVNSSARCLFPKCKNQDRKTISNEIHTKLIKHYKYYTPSSSRLCSEHFSTNDWSILLKTDSSKLKFNANHIEDMFSMVQEKRGMEIDFNDVLKLDDSLIKYLLGTTREILTSILTKEPQIRRKNNGIKGLIGLFIKHENGSSKSRISELLKLRTKSLCHAMKTIQEILSKSSITKELGLEHLLNVLIKENFQ